MKRIAATLCFCISAHASPRQKLIDAVTTQVREARGVLDALRHNDPRYVLIQDARFHALDDLEDFQAGGPLVTEERLRNDLYELRMDVHEFIGVLPVEVGGRP